MPTYDQQREATTDTSTAAATPALEAEDFGSNSDRAQDLDEQATEVAVAEVDVMDIATASRTLRPTKTSRADSARIQTINKGLDGMDAALSAMTGGDTEEDRMNGLQGFGGWAEHISPTVSEITELATADYRPLMKRIYAMESLFKTAFKALISWIKEKSGPGADQVPLSWYEIGRGKLDGLEGATRGISHISKQDVEDQESYQAD